MLKLLKDNKVYNDFCQYLTSDDFFCYISFLEAGYLLKRVTSFKKLKAVVSEENQYAYYLHQTIS